MAKNQAKPKKPYADFPLFAHATGRWCKKIRGRHHYFGPWDDPQGAIALYESQREDLYAGRTPRVPDDRLTIRRLLNAFLTEKRRRVDSGELALSTFKTYYDSCARIGKFFGKTRAVADLGVEDFRDFRHMLAQGWSASTLATEINKCRCVFKFAFDNHLLSAPVRYGSAFSRPTKTTLRKARNQAGLRMFEADDIRRILDVVDLPLRGAVLLGINCGFGNTDVRLLPRASVNLDRRWIHFPRPKTGVERKCPIWPETAETLGEIIACLPPKARLIFECWKTTRNGDMSSNDPLCPAFRRVLEKLGIYRPRVAFYALRHSFETIAGDSGDQVATNSIMGHVDDSMAAVYRERVRDARLVAVSDHVRRWLFEADDQAGSEPEQQEARTLRLYRQA